ncbi:class I SAM-dependent methyltransferase [Stappia sediminis]|uniref:class I SAM-dependent methyltransferase n=1 Tax=Stappia sediminis TaxID=2692190 RepID=UPI0028B027E0|nr:class I SAM-dependent methyltransferase [Stappia sediminis]
MSGRKPETRLAARLKRRIAADGPITVADFMNACLSDPEDGYYMMAEPFGAGGDFITAPEVSQLFGELIGAWLVHVWRLSGSPPHFHLVEPGPGRGTLMADALRVARLDSDFMKAAHLTLVETSPRLREKQAETLAKAPLKPQFASHLGEIADNAPLFLVANEFFDALPIHQHILTGDGWRERMVGLDDAGELCFGIGPASLASPDVPAAARNAAPGAVLETQPLSNAIATSIGERIATRGGAALVIDYGYLRSAPGDTLQAIYRHEFDPVLVRPGEADLTAHVNFEALGHAFRSAGAQVGGPMTQGDFLIGLGLLERAGQLGAGKPAHVQERIRADVERLAGPDAMGTLFKVLAVTKQGLSPPPFDT